MSDRDPATAVSRGMRSLLARREAELAAGAAPVGWKIGFNTPAIQEVFGLDDPVVGYLVDSGVSPDGAVIPIGRWGAPAVEVEVAVRVGDDGGVAGLAPALELVDLDVSFDDIEPVLAANVCQRGVIFGDEVPGVDPWAMVAVVYKADHEIATGAITEDPRDTVAFVRTVLGGPRRDPRARRPHHRRLGRRTSSSRGGRLARCLLRLARLPAGGLLGLNLVRRRSVPRQAGHA